MTRKLTRDDVLATIHLSSRDAAAMLDCGKSTVNDARRRFNITTDKTSETHIIADDATTIDSVLQTMRDGTTDLTNHTLGFTTVERELADGSVRHQFTIRATPKKNPDTELPPIDELIAAMDKWVPEERQPVAQNGQSPIFVVCAADMQVGKVSDNGGTEELEERVKRSFDRAVTKARQAGGYPAIVVADLGDIIENFYNVASQRETNDRDLTSQVRIARRLLQYGINALAPHCQVMYVVSVPSNHGSVKVGFKAEAGFVNNDWGVAINEQLEEVYRDREGFDHVNFLRPEGLEDSIGLRLATEDGNVTTLGFVHGHQSGRAEKLRDWFAGQALGRGPVATADILLVGHYHSFRMQQGGDERWIIVAPASDNGSDWYRRLTGDKATAGMLTFEATQGTWINMEIV